MKRFIFLVFIILVGCASREKDVSIIDIKNKIKPLMTVDVEELYFDSNEVVESYGISLDEIEEGIILAAKEDKYPDRVIIIKCKTDEAIESVDEGISTKRDELDRAWEHEDEAEYKKVQNAIVKMYGMYSFLIIAEQSNDIVEVLDEIFKV